MVPVVLGNTGNSEEMRELTIDRRALEAYEAIRWPGLTALLCGAVHEAFAPNIVASGADTAQDGLGINRRRHRLMDPQPEGHFEAPALRTGASGDIGSQGIERDGI
jgi:hypothetical protein